MDDSRQGEVEQQMMKEYLPLIMTVVALTVVVWLLNFGVVLDFL